MNFSLLLVLLLNASQAHQGWCSTVPEQRSDETKNQKLAKELAT